MGRGGRGNIRSQGHHGQGYEFGVGGGLGGEGIGVGVVGGSVAEVWFGRFSGCWGFARGELFMKIAKIFSSERQVLNRTSTTSIG